MHNYFNVFILLHLNEYGDFALRVHTHPLYSNNHVNTIRPVKGLQEHDEL